MWFFCKEFGAPFCSLKLNTNLGGETIFYGMKCVSFSSRRLNHKGSSFASESVQEEKGGEADI